MTNQHFVVDLTFLVRRISKVRPFVCPSITALLCFGCCLLDALHDNPMSRRTRTKRKNTAIGILYIYIVSLGMI